MRRLASQAHIPKVLRVYEKDDCEDHRENENCQRDHRCSGNHRLCKARNVEQSVQETTCVTSVVYRQLFSFFNVFFTSNDRYTTS